MENDNNLILLYYLNFQESHDGLSFRGPHVALTKHKEPVKQSDVANIHWLRTWYTVGRLPQWMRIHLFAVMGCKETPQKGWQIQKMKKSNIIKIRGWQNKKKVVQSESLRKRKIFKPMNPWSKFRHFWTSTSLYKYPIHFYQCSPT